MIKCLDCKSRKDKTGTMLAKEIRENSIKLKFARKDKEKKLIIRVLQKN